MVLIVDKHRCVAGVVEACQEKDGTCGSLALGAQPAPPGGTHQALAWACGGGSEEKERRTDERGHFSSIHIQVPDSPVLAFSKNFALQVWVKPDSWSDVPGWQREPGPIFP
jgi:hypothetical protein